MSTNKTCKIGTEESINIGTEERIDARLLRLFEDGACIEYEGEKLRLDISIPTKIRGWTVKLTKICRDADKYVELKMEK